MAGSRKWFVYTTDAGDDFAISLDESNTESLNGGVQDFPNVAPTQYALPRNIKPRTVTYRNAAGTIARKVVGLTATIFGNAVTGAPTIVDQVSGETLTLYRRVGEVVSLPFGADTGLTDGDAT